MSLKAGSLEFFLDHTPQEIFRWEHDVDGEQSEIGNLPSLDPSFYSILQIENMGSEPIKNCFPHLNHVPYTSMEALASHLREEKYPLLVLYNLWKQSVEKNEMEDNDTCHPLDLINFKGTCSPSAFSNQFIKLCNALGVETRLARVHGECVCDFHVDEDWCFLDLQQDRLYLGLDNETPVSSEGIMDDPFLLLRAKHDRRASTVDFREAWRQLARFDILEPASASPVETILTTLREHAHGLDLYPFETLLMRKERNSNSCYVEHTLQLESRHSPVHFHYISPFPIQKLTNSSNTALTVDTWNITLAPGETFQFQDSEIFSIFMVFSSPPKGNVVLSGQCASGFFPALVRGKNCLSIGKENPTILRLRYINSEANEATPLILNQKHHFGYTSPYFQVANDAWEKMWWQISLDPNFQLIPSNFDQIQSFSSTITLPLVSETLLNEWTPYYFRIKGFKNGEWSEWSPLFSFSVQKPASVREVECEPIGDAAYELRWDRCAEESEEPIEYWVFGSNALDFVPSLYCPTQVTAIADGEFTEEKADNFIAVVQEPKIRVNGSLAYYRIIAKKCGQYSVPSQLIHLYDQDLIHPRNVLQISGDEDHPILAKRMLLPPPHAYSEMPLPCISKWTVMSTPSLPFQTLVRAAVNLEHLQHPYESPDVPNEVWDEVRPYLLPANHPAWPKLNRVFCTSRATQSSETFRKAGFKRWRPGRWSRVSASSHPELKEYFIKAYCDSEGGIIYDWKKWIHRIKGAETVRDCIATYGLQSSFKVPHKWIYPLPKYPDLAKTKGYVKKNFVLVAENMRIEEHDRNEKLYKHMNKKMMQGLYTVLQVCGLYDSVYCFNIPFCKDGKMAVIDTEYHHKWPVPFEKLTRNFSKSSQSYWKELTYHGGRIPNGISQPNPPRMDRRDLPGL